MYLLRIGDLEGAVDKMRNQQVDLQKRLKEEMDRKTKLEVYEIHVKMLTQPVVKLN